MGPASWQEGFGNTCTNDGGEQQEDTAYGQQQGRQQPPRHNQPQSAAAPSLSFARNDFEANQSYGEEGGEEPMGVGALSALLGGTGTDRNTRSGREVVQSQQGQQAPSQARPTPASSASQSAPVDKGSTSLSRSDLMRMICGGIGDGGKEDSAAGNANGSSKRRKVEPARKPSANGSSGNAQGTSTSASSNNGGGSKQSNGLFSVSLPSDDSDSDSD